jgi:hypothetical protein
LTVAIREDRLAEFAGVRLVLASLWRHCPEIAVKVYLTPEHIDLLAEQLHVIHPAAELRAFAGVSGWACKPAVLLDALGRAGDGERVLWLDTDTIVVRSLAELTAVPGDRIIVAEETNPNDNALLARRQALLGVAPGVPRETTISSAVVGVTARHRAILEHWDRLVRSEIFLAQQKLPSRARLLFGDQEILEAVLCSPEWAEVGVEILRNWRDLLQGTYTAYGPAPPPRQAGKPLLVHATGDLKPWRRSRLRLAQEIFPYFDQGQSYLAALPVEDRAAFQSRSRIARAFKACAKFEDYARLRRLLSRVQTGLRAVRS